ncbi:hypothetical protein EJ08DRAFT_681369 [Tothia fuscella]|uniref:Uncharacterized protein n=1 Tax=Tothia fuscella TaxID=1048955 RepID=A0A9P4NKP5_9PEZI|nr:hypothetical protein EJ08DRAFT_681369 [Tothia fuscella]
MSQRTSNCTLLLTSRTLALIATLTAQALTLYTSINIHSGSSHAAVTTIGIAASLIANISEIATLSKRSITQPHLSLAADSVAWICLSVGATLELASMRVMRERVGRLNSMSGPEDVELIDSVVGVGMGVYFTLAVMHLVMSIVGVVIVARSEDDEGMTVKGKDFEGTDV